MDNSGFRMKDFVGEDHLEFYRVRARLFCGPDKGFKPVGISLVAGSRFRDYQHPFLCRK